MSLRALACFLCIAAGCRCQTRNAPRTPVRLEATGIAMTLDGSRDLFTPTAGSTPGAVTSDGEGSCINERASGVFHLFLRTASGFQACDGNAAPEVSEWGIPRDVVALVCAASEEALVVADGTVWTRSEPLSPFRLIKDCSPQWHDWREPCREYIDSTSEISAPPSICGGYGIRSDK